MTMPQLIVVLSISHKLAIRAIANYFSYSFVGQYNLRVFTHTVILSDG